MVGTLIFILFMFNGLTVLAIILLYLRQNKIIEMENNQRKNQEEFAELFSDFLMELKEENDQFVSVLNNLNANSKRADEVFKEDEKADKTDLNASLNQELPITTETYSRLLAFKTYDQDNSNAPSSKKIEKTLQEMTFSEQVDNLQEQGLTIEEIAKTLNKGKTEIELMLKFRR